MPVVVWILLGVIGVPVVLAGGCFALAVVGAAGRHSDSTAGVNVEAGPTLNAYDRARSACATAADAMRHSDPHANASNAKATFQPVIDEAAKTEEECKTAKMHQEALFAHVVRMEATRKLAVLAPDPGTPSWLTALGAVAVDTESVRPKSVDKSDPGEVAYRYAFPPFSKVTLTIVGGESLRWDITTTTKDRSVQAALLESATPLCPPKAGSTVAWYSLDSGPLAGSFLSVDAPDTNGVFHTMVMSFTGAMANKAEDEAKGTPHTDSVKDYVCL